jgi:hypothetical protein
MKLLVKIRSRFRDHALKESASAAGIMIEDFRRAEAVAQFEEN